MTNSKTSFDLNNLVASNNYTVNTLRMYQNTGDTEPTIDNLEITHMCLTNNGNGFDPVKRHYSYSNVGYSQAVDLITKDVTTDCECKVQRAKQTSALGKDNG